MSMHVSRHMSVHTPAHMTASFLHMLIHTTTHMFLRTATHADPILCKRVHACLRSSVISHLKHASAHIKELTNENQNSVMKRLSTHVHTCVSKRPNTCLSTWVNTSLQTCVHEQLAKARVSIRHVVSANSMLSYTELYYYNRHCLALLQSPPSPPPQQQLPPPPPPLLLMLPRSQGASLQHASAAGSMLWTIYF